MSEKNNKEIKPGDITSLGVVEGQHGSFYEPFIISMTIFSLLVVVILAFFPISEAVVKTLTFIDWLICLIFLVDFGRNMYLTPNRRAYFFKGGGWLDLLGSIPPFPNLRLTSALRLFRIARLVRIVPVMRARGPGFFLRGFTARKAQSTLLVTVFLTIVLISISAVVVLQVETRSAEANITNGTDAFWWAFVTATTVGYGDKYPTTELGRIMAMILMTVGVGVFGVLASYMASIFLATSDESDLDKSKEGAPESQATVDPSALQGELTIIHKQMALMQESMQRLADQMQEMRDNS